MKNEEFSYDEVIAGDTKIEHATVMIGAGQNLAAYTPIKHDESTGHFIALTKDDKKAHYLTAIAVSTSSVAKAVTVIKAISINQKFVVYPEDMTSATKSGIFAGTPISVQLLV